MPTLSPEDILRMEPDLIPAFIQNQASAKTLSGLVRQLNSDLMQGDRPASELAAKALQHLGFVDTV